MKKSNWIMACALSFGVAMSLSAYAADEKPAGHGPGGHGPAGDPEARFKAADADGNGTISLAEFKAGHEKRMAAMKERMGDKFDASKAPNPDEVFKKLDTNGDGQLSKEEMKEGHKNMGGPGGHREGGEGGHGGHKGGVPKAAEGNK